MHDPENLVASLRARGVELWHEGEQLHFRAPKGTLSNDDLTRLRTQKALIVAQLKAAHLLSRIERVARSSHDIVPLTALQMRAWREIVQHKGGRSQRLVFRVERVLGCLDVTALQESLRSAVQRHDALRIGIVVVDGVTRQQVRVQSWHAFELIDLSGPAAASSDTAIAQLCEQFVREPIDLREAPMLAARLFRVSAREHVFIFAIDHMASDAVSLEIVTREIWLGYRQASRGQAPAIPAPPLQFLDYVVWQHQTHDAWLEAHADYWRQRMQSPPAGLADCTPSAAVDPPNSGMVSFPFDAALTGRLRAAARREQSLLATLMLAICARALSRWTKRRDFLVACVSNGRDRPELQEMVGFLADYLHLRIRIDDGEAFSDLCRRLTAEFRSAYEHQDYGRVPDLLPECECDLGFNWIARSGTEAPHCGSEATAGELAVESFECDPPFPLPRPFNLALFFYETDTEVVGGVAYRPDVFAEQRVESLMDEIKKLADEVSHQALANLSPNHRAT